MPNTSSVCLFTYNDLNDCAGSYNFEKLMLEHPYGYDNLAKEPTLARVIVTHMLSCDLDITFESILESLTESCTFSIYEKDEQIFVVTQSDSDLNGSNNVFQLINDCWKHVGTVDEEGEDELWHSEWFTRQLLPLNEKRI